MNARIRLYHILSQIVSIFLVFFVLIEGQTHALVLPHTLYIVRLIRDPDLRSHDDTSGSFPRLDKL